MTTATAQDTSMVSTTIDRTTAIVSAYVSNNPVPLGEVPGLIASIHTALGNLGNAGAQAAPEAAVDRPTPSQIRKSIAHDHLTSFIDGKTYKTLKRHLTGAGLTPETYRAKFGLPADYPMTSAAYSAQRSSLAKSLGLGQQRRKDAPVEAEAKPVKGGKGKRAKADHGTEAQAA